MTAATGFCRKLRATEAEVRDADHNAGGSVTTGFVAEKST
jgi:hypothetical protein